MHLPIQCVYRFRNGNILDLSQPENTINMGIGIFCLMNDKRQEILWLGTDGQGIRMFYDKPDLFGSILLKDLPINIQNPIRSLFTDDDQSLWLGTKETVLSGYKRMTLTITKDDPTKRYHAFYHRRRPIQQPCVLLPKSEYHPCIWIGTEGPGLTYYSYKEKRIKRYRNEKTPPLYAMSTLFAR